MSRVGSVPVDFIIIYLNEEQEIQWDKKLCLDILGIYESDKIEICNVQSPFPYIR